ncbi:MAG: pyridoxal-phosphate dependent enzyme [Anaerolineales bacterium]|nr:pyridoxal-phosphate dependent enzyme [Anaerolineales bacterium]
MSADSVNNHQPIATPAIDNPVWSLVGHTPLIPLKEILSRQSLRLELYGKAEWYNPGGSVKDRPAAMILSTALKAGWLDGSVALLDSTSGNMGIAYATLGAAVGVPVHLVIPGNAGPERMGYIRALGAHLTLSDPLEGSDGAHDVATEMAKADPGRYYFADQYNNPANWQAHYSGTGPEIWSQTQGGITHFIAGMGTTGTITGTGRFLKEQNPDVQIIGVQPDGPLHGLEGLKHIATSPTPGIFDADVLDEILEVPTEATYQLLRELAQKQGLLLGVSAGAALVAARELAHSLTEAKIVVILPDSGLKYLSLPFWGQT